MEQNYKHFFPQECRDVIYLDNAATTLKPTAVISAMTSCYSDWPVNIKRSVSKQDSKYTDIYNRTKEKIKSFLHAYNYDVIFTTGTTEGLNIVSKYISTLTKDNSSLKLATTYIEHHSNYLPWKTICDSIDKSLLLVPLDDAFKLQLTDNLNDVDVLALTHASNVLGNIQNAKPFIDAIHRNEGLCILDIAQTVGHTIINLDQLNPDFAAFSAHKVFGPFGIGVLLAKRDLVEKMPPFKYGGGMVRDAKSSTFHRGAEKFEAGTINLPAVVGFERAIDFISEVGIDTIQSKLNRLTDYLISQLEDIPSVKILSPQNNNIGIVSFTVNNLHPHDLNEVMDSHNIRIRTGHHCAQPLMEYLRIKACSRVSLHFYNTTDEIASFTSVLKQTIMAI